MFYFILRKMWKNKWIMLSLLIGNILLIGIVSAVPIYTQATMQRILIRDMEHFQHEMNTHPATIELEFSFNDVPEQLSEETYEAIVTQVIPFVVDNLGIPVYRIVENLFMRDFRVVPIEQREENVRIRTLNLNTFEGHEAHINLLHGRMPSSEIQDGNVIEVIANSALMHRRDLLMDEMMAIMNIVDEDSQNREVDGGLDDEDAQNEPISLFANWFIDDVVALGTYVYSLKVVGIYEATGDQGFFWNINPNDFSHDVLVSHELVKHNFLNNYDSRYNLSASWSIMLDYHEMLTHDIPAYLEADGNIRAGLARSYGNLLSYSENFMPTLREFVERTDRLTTTLLVLQVPIYVFLAFYIFVISGQILRQEQNDISVLKSRGAARYQIILMYFMQSLFVSVLSLVLGIPLGALVCILLGASSGFLELVARTALTVELNRYVFIYAGIAAAASVLMMLLPVVGFSKITILDHKRGKSRKNKKPFWQRFFIDVLFVGVSIYGYYNFISRREILALAAVDAQAVDPLLFISSSLFIVGLGLLCLRLYPYLIKLVFRIGKKFWSPAPYASLLKAIRFSSDEKSIMIFLIFTLSLGIFSAQAARTLNTNSEHLIQHKIGADLVFAERFRDNIPAPMPGAPVEMPDRIIYTEPDFERFTGFSEVDSLTRVMRSTVALQRDRSVIDDVMMMAIDTKTFGETIWNRDDLLPIHINHFLNTLALREEGVLLSDNFRTRFGFEVNEWITYTDEYGNVANGIILGFVETWPGFSDRIRVQDAFGTYSFEDAYLIVANLGHIHSTWGMFHYQVWFRTNTPSNRFFYEFLEESNIIVIHFEDAKASIIDSRNDPILQGSNGVMTTGFIFTFLACFVGFLIYWALSIKARALQFGVFNAMGMTRRDLVKVLVYEQILISFSAIIIGLLVGEIAARLFVPLIQLAYSPALQPIPLMLVIESRDYVNIFSILGFMIIVCLVILGVLVSKVKAAHALKLGED